MSKEPDNFPALLDLKEKKSLTELKREQRVNDVMFMVTTGISTARVVKDTMEKYNVSKQVANAYLSAALMELSQHTRAHTIEARMAHRLSQLEALYEACTIEKDYKTAAAIMKQITDLSIPKAPQEHNLTVTSRIANMSPEEREERLKVLLKERENFIEATCVPADEEEHKQLYEQAVDEFSEDE